MYDDVLIYGDTTIEIVKAILSKKLIYWDDLTITPSEILLYILPTHSKRVSININVADVSITGSTIANIKTLTSLEMCSVGDQSSCKIPFN